MNAWPCWPVTNYSDYIIVNCTIFSIVTVSIALALAHSNSTIDNDVI